jgi:hypothetical protein
VVTIIGSGGIVILNRLPVVSTPVPVFADLDVSERLVTFPPLDQRNSKPEPPLRSPDPIPITPFVSRIGELIVEDEYITTRDLIKEP